MNGVEGANGTYVEWIRSKHQHQRREFVEELVSECIVEFGSRDALTDEQRAEIYNRVRQNLQRVYDDRLRKHARICCCS